MAHRLPRATTVRWNFYIPAVNTVFEHKGDIIQCFEIVRGVWAYHCAGSFFLNLFHCIMPRVEILLSQLQKQTIDSVFVWRIMHLQRILFNTGNSRPTSYKGTTSSEEGVWWTSPNGSMPPMRVDCKGPFIAACSFNFTFGTVPTP